MTNPKDTPPPTSIWLQWYGDGDPEIEGGPIRDADVTWERQQIFGHDIEFVPRADMDAKVAALEAEIIRLQLELAGLRVKPIVDAEKESEIWP